MRLGKTPLHLNEFGFWPPRCPIAAKSRSRAPMNISVSGLLQPSPHSLETARLIGDERTCSKTICSLQNPSKTRRHCKHLTLSYVLPNSGPPVGPIIGVQGNVLQAKSKKPWLTTWTIFGKGTVEIALLEVRVNVLAPGRPMSGSEAQPMVGMLIGIH